MTPRERRPTVMSTLRALAFWAAFTGGASALAAGVMLTSMHAGTPFAGFAASALALVAMALVPSALARRFATRATVPVASALVLTMAAMGAAAEARAGATGVAAPLALGGIALLAAAWLNLRRDTSKRSVPTHATAHRAGARFVAQAWRNNARLVAPALLAGLSSGVLARFQFFAICGSATASVTHVAASLAVVTLAGWLAERVDHRHALLACFVTRGALLAALTLGTLAPWAALAAPAFAVLDYLTLPTLMRGGGAARASRAGCPGLAHHAGMLAGAAFATTSWGFGQGFYMLFLVGAALNVACAFMLATPRRSGAHIHYPAAPALAADSGIDLR